MDIHEMRRLADLDKNKTVRIYNPDTEDFTKPFNDGNGIKKYTIPALEMVEFPFHVGKHLKKHLADRLLNKRNPKTNPQDDLEEIMKEIEVELE